MRTNFRYLVIPLMLVSLLLLSGCESFSQQDIMLAQNTKLQLVDWHVAGLWVINSPVAWVRVTNYNPVPIRNIIFEYSTYNAEGNQLDQGTFTIEGTVAPGSTSNFIELYLGLVNLYSEGLTLKLLSVKQAS